MRALLSSYLQLLAHQAEIPVATVADVVLFAAREKRALRFAVSPATAQAIDGWAAAHELATASRGATIRQVAPGWNALEPTGAGERVEVLIVAADGEAAAELADCEVRGEARRAGSLLGYPACCVAAYADHSPAGWIVAALAACDFKPSQWCNRLPIHWRAPTFIGEIYPCSFACPHLTALGQRVDTLLRAQGLTALAQRISDESLRPVCFRPARSHPANSALVPLSDERLPDFIEFAS